MEQRRTEPAAPRAPMAATALRYGIAVLALTLVVLVAATAGPLVLEERTAAPPAPQPAVDIPPPPLLELPEPAPGWEVDLSWMWWVLAALAALILVAILRRLARLVRRRVRLSAETGDALPALLTPASVGLADSVAEVDFADGRLFDAARSADDIIASWTALERAAALIGLPREVSATPTEFLETLGAAVPGAPELRDGAPGLRDDASGLRRDADVLLDAYHRARFDTAALAPGVATAARRAARAWVQVCARLRAGDTVDQPDISR